MNEFLQSMAGKEYFFGELTEKYLTAAAEVLIAEWPRNLRQRCFSLKEFMVEESESNQLQYRLPISLILISRTDNKVVGHVTLVSIATNNQNKIENLVFLQSLVIDKSLRGKGLGRLVVTFCELYLREFDRKQCIDAINKTNCRDLYLTTKDKQSFYERLGFVRTESINFFAKKNPESKNILIMNQLLKNLNTSLVNDTHKEPGLATSEPVALNSIPDAPPAPPLRGLLPPPPPPPPQLPSFNQPQSSSKQNADPTVPTTWYKKRIL